MSVPTYSSYFFKGTAIGWSPFTYDDVRPLAIEMIVNMLKDKDFKTKKDLADYLYKQTEELENNVCRFSNNGNIDENTIEMVAKFYEKNVDWLRSFWCANIVAMLELKRIPNNDNFGYLEMSGETLRYMGEDPLKELQKKCSHTVGVQASRRRRGKSKKKKRRGQTYAHTMRS
tara:strand:- start:81 stop:599 length:519 start_codon:yes stop_codon:yes gene_type:complete